MKSRALFVVFKKGVSLFLVLSFFIQTAGLTLISALLFSPNVAEAAQVVIQGSPNTTGASHTQSGVSTVFVSDQVGYKFYRHGAAPSSGTCGYVKTTNGGTSWGSYVVVDTRTDCISVSVWYDKWTPGDTGDYVHISTIDTTSDELFYNRLDTTSDTLLLANSVSAALGVAGTFVGATNENSVTKATDGKIYMVVDDSNGTQLRSCAASCNLSASWSTVGTPPQGNANSFSMLMPLSGGNVMLINRSTTNVLRSSIWNGTSWSAFTTIDGAAVQNTTYDVGVAATLDIDSGDIYIAYVTDNNDFVTQDHDIRTRVYSGGSWSSKTDVLTNVAGRGLLQVAIARNQNNGDIYVAYTARATIATANTANVYWKQSTDGMTSWGAQQGPMDTSSADMYGVDVNIMAEERLYVSWYDVTATDLIGDTMADIGPEVRLSSLGTQTSVVRASTSSFYSGGAFLLETLSTRTVSSVVISESGTIDAQANVKNVKLFYEFDTSSPYNCVSESYSGSETPFGSTVSSGFSGSDGTAPFTATPVSFGPTSAMCFYAVMDIQSTAVNGNTVEISIENPVTDVLVSGGIDVKPTTAITLAGTTTVVDPNLTQFGYHWRLDNGTEVTASSATSGVEDTPLPALQIGTPRRLRVGVANQGSTTTLASAYRLEYGEAAPTCGDVSSWEVVGNSNSAWIMSNSANLTDGNNTTNILPASGGLTDLPSTSFLASNGAIKDTATSTGSLTLAVNNFIETEFSIVASTSASQGSTYCFRVANSLGYPLSVYSEYPKVTISADVTIQSFGTQTLSVNVGTTSAYAGGGFGLIENSSNRNITSVKLTESGTVNGATGLNNLKLFYDLDTSNPYNCASESYSGLESQYGSTIANAFSDPGESAEFTDTVNITTTSSLCLYVVYDVDNSAQNGETIQLSVNSPTVDIGMSSGSIGPSTPIEITGTTTIEGAILNQLAYHWRNDDGNETGATSASAGSQNTPLTEFAQSSPIRLRLAVTNTGLVSSVPARYRLEYSPKITTCSAASVWTPVDASSDGWDMFDSTFISNAQNTTDIALGVGGVSNGAGSFIAGNAGVRDTEDLSATTTIPTNDYLDLEFSITSTAFTSYDTNYCFRVSSEGLAFQTYTQYAEITTAPKRDFKIQRGSVQVSGTSTIVTAGVGYTAPASSSRAFVRITNSHYTGAGNSAATAGQNADDVTAYISNPQNILTSFTISRPAAATSNTRVDWEIVEFIGNSNTDNEIIVRDVRTINFTTATIVATGTSVAVNNDNKVVVFITGVTNQNTSRNFYASQVTSEWEPTTNVPVFKRGANGASIALVSYAVVEFVGANWNVQRAQHSYTAAGVTETESITAVNSLARTFIHAQKRMGATTNVVHYGHEVWLSSIGAVSFALETGASVAVEQTSVAWIIENTQTSSGAMNVQRSFGTTNAGTGPLSLSITLGTPIEATNNTSIMANTRAAGANTTFPRPNAGFTITSTSTYQIWRSNTGSLLTYRVELVEWPVADLAIRQTNYQFFTDNNALTPDDRWPLGLSDLGESTSITVANEPPGNGDIIRVRISLHTSNANMPAGLVNFKLQYALRSTTCTALGELSWSDVGQSGSGAVWRGYSATGTTDGTALSTNPPTGGDLIISYANRAGTLEHENPSAVNPYPVLDGDYLEYDWYLQHNGAIPLNTYCFRTVRSDGTPLDGYDSNYPQIRTAGFSPVAKNWRWYSDETVETPLISLANETVAPIDIANTDTLALRISVREKRNVQGDGIKFKLQFSDDISFANPVDVVATSSCGDLSLWCYTEGAVHDNTIISNKLLTDAESCASGVGNGCGRHNSSPLPSAVHNHLAGKTQEYSFTIKHAAARVNAVYYFRLYDITNDSPVSLDTGESYASLVTEGSDLVLTVSGLLSGTTTAGVVTNVPTTPNSIGFGIMAFNTEYIGAHRLNVTTNASEGYQILSFARQQLLGPGGISIPSVTATNTTPLGWSAGCLASSTGCVAYHTTDATLQGGSTRFGPPDTYAGLETTPVEVMYSSIPAVDTHDIVYRIRVNEKQPAGDYETEIVYLAVPSY